MRKLHWFILFNLYKEMETFMDIQKEIETLIGYADDNSMYGQFEGSDRTEEKPQ